MSWGTRRRNNIIFAVAIILIVPSVIGFFVLIYEKPSCFDGKRNQDEKGIDCGGSCVLLCKEDSLPLVVLWERFFKVGDGNYNAAAYIENRNSNAGVKNVNYVFSFFNQEGVKIAEKRGQTRVFPQTIKPILISGVLTGKQVPTRVDFEFLENPIFEKEDPVLPLLITKNSKYFVDSSSAGGPRVTATIQNISLEEVNDVDVVVLLFDIMDNVVGVSSTYIERINPEESKDVSFTWPNNFIDNDLRPEIIPIYESVN
jgi:hypothetical protein